MNLSKKEYSQITGDTCPASPIWKDMLLAFLVGGAICTLGQFLTQMYINYFNMDKKTASTWVSITLIALSSLLTALDWYGKIAKHAGAGTIVPITGFSNPGRTRQLSILNGLRDIDTYVKSSDKPDEDPVVIVHDSARPNLTTEYLDRCLDAIEGCDGVMPTLPMKDTVYYSENGTKVDRLLDRSCIYAGQAPELYRLKKYLEVNEKLLPDEILRINGSTEPAVMAGLDVAMIPGDENNYKVTTKKDMDRFIQDIG